MTISDTEPEAERILSKLLRQVPVWRKMQMLGDLNRTAKQLALEGLRDKYPNAADSELQRHLADLLLGPELAHEAYGPHPSQAQVKLKLKKMNDPVFVTLYLEDSAQTMQIADLLERSFDESQMFPPVIDS